MSAPLFRIARWFLIGGALLGVVGMLFWYVLHLHSGYPPYLATAVLAMGYGLTCLLLGRRTGAKKT